MNADFIKETINTVVFLLPVLGLVWKGAKLTARLETLENNVKEKTEKLSKDLALMSEKIEQERLATDTSISSIMVTLTEIQKALVRVETKLDIENKDIKQ